jgi:hypothetical protein
MMKAWSVFICLTIGPMVGYCEQLGFTKGGESLDQYSDR